MGEEIRKMAVKGRWDYERKECIHVGKERVKEQYSPANTDVWIRLGHGKGHNSQECVLWK